YCLRGRCARPGVAAAGSDSAERAREGARRRSSTAVVDHLFDDRQRWRSVVVGDRAYRVSAVRHRAGAPSAASLAGVARAAGLVDPVAAGNDPELYPRFRAWATDAAGMTRVTDHCTIQH